MPKVFISYRRGVANHAAGRLYLELTKHILAKSVFFDIRNVGPGEVFPEVYRAFISSEADVMLAVIGDKWNENRRLDNPTNHVRQELLLAVEHHVEVIPLLLDGTAMPEASDLPEKLHFMCSLNAKPLAHETFADDAARIERAVQDLADKRRFKAGPLPALLQEKLDAELATMRSAQGSRDLTKLDPRDKVVVQQALDAERTAVLRVYHARYADAKAKNAARLAREGGNPQHACDVPFSGGGTGRWEGESPRDKREGLGEYQAPMSEGGRYSYSGHWKNDQESGLGVATYTAANGSGGSLVEGDWALGKPNGFGIRTLRSGDSFAGEFRNGQLEGPGVYRWANGKRYEGEFQSGAIKGRGAYFHTDGSAPEGGDWHAENGQITRVGTDKPPTATH